MPEDGGNDEVVVSNVCGDVLSGVGVVTVWALGDPDCDGSINFRDINPFVLALSDPVGYATQYRNCNILNGDGYVDFDDINPFVVILSGGE